MTYYYRVSDNGHLCQLQNICRTSSVNNKRTALVKISSLSLFDSFQKELLTNDSDMMSSLNKFHSSHASFCRKIN